MPRTLRQLKEPLWPEGPTRYFRQIGRVLQDGTFVSYARLPVRTEIRKVDFVLGGSMHRVALLSHTVRELSTLKTGTIVTILVKESTPKQIDKGCDMCPGEQHRPTNPLCSASVGGKSPFVFGFAYSMVTKEPVFKLRIDQCVILEQSDKVSVCQFQLYRV